MARYRKISPCIWLDAKVRGLSDKGKLTLFLLLTHPNMTSLGALRANLPGLACELGWKPAVFARAFRELLDCGMARHDADAQLIWFPKFLKHNAPESPNVVRGWATAFEELPECALKQDVLAGAWATLAAFGEGFRDAFREVFGEVLPKPCEKPSASLPESLSEAFGQPCPNQEQEQEQEQEKKNPSPLTSSRKPDNARRGDGEHGPAAQPVMASGKACRTPDARLDESLPETSAEDRPAPRRQGPPKTDCPGKGHPQRAAFLSCWQVYPVKQGEEEAWREWMRLYANGTLEQPHVIRDKILELTAGDSRWQRGKVPAFARWLNGKRWNDEPYVEPEATTNGAGGGLMPGEPRATTEYQRTRQASRLISSGLIRERDLDGETPEAPVPRNEREALTEVACG
ncbi:hypothetical protein [uncultured Desulfovibrio sp.]|uniref:hypothetical protein n=1 Tax=uncultured Desulfovibrio sp. TaxID=167968 RepID=UPI00260667A2|nr:hypothetical protein [uncultured Desulfovibrio sp.]